MQVVCITAETYRKHRKANFMHKYNEGVSSLLLKHKGDYYLSDRRCILLYH